MVLKRHASGDDIVCEYEMLVRFEQALLNGYIGLTDEKWRHDERANHNMATPKLVHTGYSIRSFDSIPPYFD